MGILIFVVFGILNGRLALRLGLKVPFWVLMTILGTIGGFFVTAIVVAINYKGTANVKEVQDFFTNNPLKMLTMLAGGVGGALLVRYIMEHKQKSSSE